MSSRESLARGFAADREHLRRVAFRILGSLDDADDAIQQAWIKLSRADLHEVQNVTAWLTTVTARECLDMLRARKRRAEVALPDEEAIAKTTAAPRSVEDEMVAAESVGRALLVVLDRLTPAERVALVLHDMFAVPFDEVATIVERSAATTKKLASRARQKVRGPGLQAQPQIRRQRELASAFLSASRSGNVDGLLAVLAPDIIRRADAAALPPGAAPEIRGADAVVNETVVMGPRAVGAEIAFINGSVGIVVAPRGRLMHALVITFGDEDRISGYDVVADPARLEALSITLPDYQSATSG